MMYITGSLKINLSHKGFLKLNNYMYNMYNACMNNQFTINLSAKNLPIGTKALNLKGVSIKIHPS